MYKLCEQPATRNQSSQVCAKKCLRNSYLHTACFLNPTIVATTNNYTDDNVWEQDLGDSFNIDASVDNLQKLNLRCGADSMHVELETVDDFTGVMYTRGSFHKQAGPCFIKPKGGRAVRSLRMKFGLEDCLTNQVE